MSQKKPTFDLPVNIRSSYIVRDIFSNAIILDRDIAIRNTMAKTLGLKTSSTDNKRGVYTGWSTYVYKYMYIYKLEHSH